MAGLSFLCRSYYAVLDSGLDYDEDIPFVERKDFLGEQELHPIYQDKTGHGTSVAGVICAKELPPTSISMPAEFWMATTKPRSTA